MVEHLCHQGHTVVALVRRPPQAALAPEAQVVLIANGEPSAYEPALHGAEVFLHLAGRAHQSGQGAEALKGFERDNQGLSAAVGTAAARAGVPRWLFLSSAKVYGNASPRLPDASIKAYAESDPTAPADAYGESKFATERVLTEIAAKAGIELCILRPPLIVGRGAKGNIASLRRLLRLGLPLPLAGLRNQRSLQSLSGLILLLEKLSLYPGRLPAVLNVSDLCRSTPEILQALAMGDGRKLRLFTVPEALLLRMLKALGGRSLVERLAGSFVLDNTQLRAFLPAWPLAPEPEHAFADVWMSASPTQ